MLKKFSMIVSVVALLTLALVGCKNGMLGEDEATVNGIRDMSEGRTAYVTITNFAGTGATRSAAGGSLRTIAPAQPNITDPDFLFIVEGESKGSKYGPEKVTVTNGQMNLEGLAPALWKITVTAFSKTKITQNGGNPDANDANVIMATYKTNSAIMAGTGTVDLIRVNADVKITLTTRGMGTQGNIDLAFMLHANDKTEVNNHSYKVTIGLYEKLTGALVDAVKLPDASADFTHTQAQAAMTYNKNNVPIGEYVVKVTINPDGTGSRGPWTWSDNIYVEGNQTTTNKNPAHQDLPQLIGQSPKKPSNFIIHWDPDHYNAADGNFVARFAWNRDSYNEDYFELEMMDVTDGIQKDFARYDPGTGAQATGDRDALWRAIGDTNPDIVKKGKDFASLNYPIYKSGSLLATNTYIEYTLETGRVYAFRLRATNANGSSDWVQFGTTEPNNIQYTTWKGADGANAEAFDQIATALVTVTYDLSGYMLLKNGEMQTQAVKTESEAFAYKPNNPHTFKYTAWDVGQNPTGYQLYSEGFIGQAAEGNASRVKWDSWVDKDTKTAYGIGQQYRDNFANLVLRPNAVSGNSVQLDTLNSGTYSGLITQETLLVHFADNDTPHTFTDKTADNIQAAMRQNVTTAGQNAGFGTINGVYGINVDAGARGNFVTFSVGDEINARLVEGKLLDADGRQQTVLRATYSIRQNGYKVREATGTPRAVMDLAGLGGDYTLYVEAHSDTGYNFTYQVPIAIKDKTENATP